MRLNKFFYLLCISFIVYSSGYAQPVTYNNSVNTLYEHVILQGERSDWNLGQIWYERKSPNLTSLLRIRYADRFNKNAYLTEVDLYPVFSDKFYAHFNTGTSLTRKELFPTFKVSGTAFHNIFPSLVGGIGMTYQRFAVDDVLIYNANLNWYVSDVLFMGQTFLQVRDKTPLVTGIATVRKYLRNPSYVFLKLAVGQAPQTLRFEEDVLDTFSSYFISLGGNIEVTDKIMIRSVVDYRQSIYTSATSRARFGLSVGFTFRF